MALFYDRDYGHDWNRGYDRGYRTQGGRNDFDRGFGGGYGGGAGRNFDRGFDRNFDRGERMSGDRYDQGFKSRWQTDYGDPFNDRGSRTPMRMTRGGYRGTGERDFGWGSNYDRDYSANPAGYDPYWNQNRGNRNTGRWNRYDQTYRGRGRGFGRGGYDEGWF